MAKSTTSRGLKKTRTKPTLAASRGVAAPGDLASRLNADRIKRRMTWPVYADHLGVKLSTVYKIAKRATTRPHETTVAQIEERLAETEKAEGAREVVPSGQRQPERPEN